MATQIPVKTKSGVVFYVEAEAEPIEASETARAAAFEVGVEPPRRSASTVDYADLDESDKAALGPKGGDRSTAMNHKAARKVLDETTFEKAVGVMRGLVEDVSDGLMKANPRPDQIELEFSLGLGASGSVMIFKGSANATFKLKLSWKMQER